MDIAIQARNVCYMYSSQTGFTLKSINVNVPIGSVYALIGPSGCGKTTLLKCTMGLLKPCQGSMNIFGYEPGTVESGVPGHGVGYMPQENALHSKLTVKEILQYYGRINGIPSSELKVQIRNIVQRLRLPNKRSMVSTLSGGERRRVSFAIAVFHKPRLLILDEPTVGMDPKLRVEVWNWIRNLAKLENKTVIVTTHYVEEAKADLVAFMRKGELLSETSPKALLDSLKTNSLQDVFLVLSQSQEAGYQRRESDPPREQIVADYVKPWPNSPKRSPDGPFTIPYLVGKRYLLGTLREPGAVSVMYFFQLLAVYLCYQCLGHLPKDVPLGIVTHPLAFKLNSSLAEYIPDLDDEIIDDPSLQFYNLPKIFVDFIDPIRIKVTDYEFNLDQASSDLNRAKLAGILYFPANFSTSYYLKEFSPFIGVTIHLDNETINAGRPKLIFGNLGIFFDEACRLSLELSFRKFRTHVAKLYGFYTELFREPLEIPEAIFGSLDSDRMFSNLLIISGFVVVMAYCMPLAFCCISTIYEIRDEAFVREYATGVESSQLILSRLAASFISGAPSIFIMLLFLHYVCKVNFEGSIIVGVLFLWSQMLNGIIHGLLLAHLVPDFLRCLNLSFLTAIILVCFGGNVWPLESLPYYLRPLVDLLPYASQNKAMFTLINRGTQPFLEDLPPALFKTSVSFFGCLFYAIYVTTRK